MEIILRHPMPSPEDLEVWRQFLVTYWNGAAFSDDLVGVPGDLVRQTEIRVTELLQDGSSEAIYEACRLTVAFAYKVAQQ